MTPRAKSQKKVEIKRKVHSTIEDSEEEEEEEEEVVEEEEEKGENGEKEQEEEEDLRTITKEPAESQPSSVGYATPSLQSEGSEQF